MEVRLDDLKPNTDAAGSTGVDTFLMVRERGMGGSGPKSKKRTSVLSAVCMCAPVPALFSVFEPGVLLLLLLLQMFIEFMQLLSIFRLTRIGVVWRSAAEAVLLAMSITPISSYSWMSLECVLPAGLSPQQYAFDSTLASTYIPGRLLSSAGTGRADSHCRHVWLQGHDIG